MLFRRKVIVIVERPRFNGVNFLMKVAVGLALLAAAPALFEALLMDLGLR